MNRVDVCLRDEAPAVKSLQVTVQDGVVLFYSSSFPAQRWLRFTWRKSTSSLVMGFGCLGFFFFFNLSGQNVPPNFDTLIVDSSFW